MECFNVLYLEFQKREHVVEEVSRFGALNLIDASRFEHFHHIFKKFVPSKTMERRSILEEAAGVMDSCVAIEYRKISLSHEY